MNQVGDGRLTEVLERVIGWGRALRRRAVRAVAVVGAVVTPLGWSLTVAVSLAFLAGYGLGWAELVAIAWAGTILLFAAGGYLIGRDAYLVTLAMPVTRVVAGERSPGLVGVTNPSRRHLPGVSIEVPVGGGLATFLMPGLARGAAFEDVFLVPTTRRGIISVGPVRTVRSDPIGLVRKERVWAQPIELFVHPRTLSIPSMSTGFIRDLEGHPTRNLTTDDVSFHALREYVAGDERRSIHWKSTAKTGTFMVRQFEESRRSHLMVALSLFGGDYASDDEFEMAVSVAGSLGIRAIRDGRTVSVVVSALDGAGRPGAPRGGRRSRAVRRMPAVRPLSTLSRGRLLDDLSGVEPAQTALPLQGLAAVAAETVAGISVAFLICGTPTTLAQLRAASTQFPAGVEVVAVVCDPEAPPTLRRVAELSVLTIGFLEDLQKSLARSAAA
ncbi:DUF58 domain-containing protein [Cryobacterium frigoriphilum]|uniref:DUF58 domain-containing protein n=1 Tax=Cryobacterium frigoriphilum TaxID=1259150 RepID=A0A4R8ZYC5_9MICO|nr:DUF58 domain-containing protein [Cryobacterium frigoriphilum]TFD48886.1 DUF58 domain-containing protein [Cryobacterium frigoriphilum]